SSDRHPCGAARHGRDLAGSGNDLRRGIRVGARRARRSTGRTVAVAVTDLPVDTLAGRVLAGRYRLDHLVATGGMAQVWDGTDQVLARRVAVKVLHPHLAADATFVARFRREAVAAARLSHPSIVSIYDTVSADGVEAIVMELVKGQSLRQ